MLKHWLPKIGAKGQLPWAPAMGPLDNFLRLEMGLLSLQSSSNIDSACFVRRKLSYGVGIYKEANK